MWIAATGLLSIHTYSCVLEIIGIFYWRVAAIFDDRVIFCIGAETRLLGFLGWLQ